MIENVELTRKILEHIASVDRFPAGVLVEHLEKAIDKDDSSGDIVGHRERIKYHVVLAHDAGFLIGGEYQCDNMDMGLVLNECHIKQIDGLSLAGCNFVRYANSNFLKRATAIFGKDMVKATSTEMLKMFMRLASETPIT